MANNADDRIILDTEIDSQGFKRGSAEMQRAIKSLGKKYQDIGSTFDKSTKKVAKTLSNMNSKSAVKELQRLQKELQQTEAEFSAFSSKNGKYGMASLKSFVDFFKEAKGRAPDRDELAAVNEGYAKTYDKASQLLQKQDELKAKISELKQTINTTGEQANVITEKSSGIFAKIKNDLAGVKTAMQEAEPLSTQMLRGFAAVLDPILRIKEGLESALWASKPFWDKLDAIESTIKSKASAAKESLKSIFQDPKATAQSLISSVQNGFNTVKSKATDVGNSIKYAFQNPKETIATLVSNATMGARNIGQKFSELGPRIKTGFGNAASSLNQKLGQVVAGARALGGNIAGYVVSGLGAAVRGAGQLALKLGGAALNGVKRLGSAILSGVVNGLKKAVNGAKTLVKNIGGRLLSGIKKATTGFAGMRKSADGITKKITKMGLALLGMRGIWGGIRQIVSSALNNNEKLQNQLTAVKGVLGQALTPAINVLVKGLGQIVTFADKIYQIFTGTSLIAQYNAAAQQKAADSIKDQNKQAKELKRQLAGFDSLNILSDSSSDSSSSSDSNSGEAAALFKATDISGWLSDIITQIKNGDWYSVGETIAGGINSALAKINWTDIQNKVNTFCTNLGKAVNGFVDALDWEQVGNTIGEGINTITGGINSFVDTVDWESFGANLSTGLNSAVKKIDGKALGKTLSAKLKILTETLYGFFNGDEENEGFNFKELGSTIGDTINGWFDNIDWSHVGSNITSAIGGLGDTISGMADKIDWNGIATDIEDFFAGMDWSAAVKKLTTGLGKALGGLASTVGKLICDAFGNISAYFDDQIDAAGGNVIEGVFNGIVNWLKNVGTWIKENILTPFIDGFKSTFDIHSPSKDPTILSLGENIIVGIFNGIVNWIGGIKSWLKTNVFDKITEAWDGFKDLSINILANVQEKVGSKLESIKSGISDIFGKDGKISQVTANVVEKAKSKLDNIKNGIASIFGKDGKTAQITANVKEKVKNAISNIGKGIANIFKNKGKTATVTANVKEKTKGAINRIKNGINSIMGKNGKLATVTAEFKDRFTGAFKKAGNALIDGLNKIIDWINKMLPGNPVSRITTRFAEGGIVKGQHTKGSGGRYAMAAGGIANNRGPGVPAIVGEAGPEAVLPLNKRTLGMLASLIMEQAKNSIFANLTSAIQQAIRNLAKTRQTVPKLGDSALLSSVDGITNSLNNGFTKIASQLQAIANGVNFRIPEAVNLIPYKNRGAGDVQFEQITRMLDMSNEELISVLIQLFNNQTREIVNALKSLKLIVPYDKRQQVQDVIDEINRRIRVTNNNPLLT